MRILERLEEELGSPLGSHFDLIAGTSVGGLLALALALHIPVNRIASLFVERGEGVFRASPFNQLLAFFNLPTGLFGAPYDPSHLHSLVTELVGEATGLEALRTQILIPAFDLSDGKPHEFRNRDVATYPGLSLANIALATTAAPSYFPVQTIGNQLFVDGGLHANTPDVLAISEAIAVHGADLANVVMISVGTTFSSRPLPVLRDRRVGLVRWLRTLGLIELLLEAQNQGSVFLSDRFIRDRYFRINRYLVPSVARRLSLARADARARTILDEAAAQAWARLIRDKAKASRLKQAFRG